jgi:hypothetical protein
VPLSNMMSLSCQMNILMINVNRETYQMLFDPNKSSNNNIQHNKLWEK